MNHSHLENNFSFLCMCVLQSTIEDYLEMYLQFGYVFLFSSAFPTAALWALFNNIIEIRSDAFKFCRIFQRPFSQPAAGIGTWQVSFLCNSRIMLAFTPPFVFCSGLCIIVFVVLSHEIYMYI